MDIPTTPLPPRRDRLVLCRTITVRQKLRISCDIPAENPRGRPTPWQLTSDNMSRPRKCPGRECSSYSCSPSRKDVCGRLGPLGYPVANRLRPEICRPLTKATGVGDSTRHQKRSRSQPTPTGKRQVIVRRLGIRRPVATPTAVGKPVRTVLLALPSIDADECRHADAMGWSILELLAGKCHDQQTVAAWSRWSFLVAHLAERSGGGSLV